MNKEQLAYFPTWLNHHVIHLSMIKDSLPYWTAMSATAERNRGGSRPLGIVFDLDEVLVSPFPVQQPSLARFFHPVERGYCPAYRNAVDLVNTCHKMNLMVYFVTARTHEMRRATVENLSKLGLAADILITMKEGDDPKTYKTATRKAISERCRIIASIGDQLSDLGNYTDVNYLIPNPFYRSGNYSS